MAGEPTLPAIGLFWGSGMRGWVAALLDAVNMTPASQVLFHGVVHEAAPRPERMKIGNLGNLRNLAQSIYGAGTVDGGEPRRVLSYSTLPVPGGNWFVRLIKALPSGAIALVLVLGLMCFDYLALDDRIGMGFTEVFHSIRPFALSAVMFTAGALRRCNWRHGILMLAVVGIWYGANKMLGWWGPGLGYPYFFLPWSLSQIVVVGLAEWFLEQSRSYRSLAWLLALALAASCLLALITEPLNFTGCMLDFWRVGRLRLGDLFFVPLLSVLMWTAVPLSLRLGQRTGRHVQLAAGGMAALCIGCFPLFFHGISYRLARNSLNGNGVFSRTWALAILEQRSSPHDLEAIWALVERADWTADESMDSYDYRRKCIDLLAARDRQALGKRLSEILRKQPSKWLAGNTAELLANQKRYEVVPVLMRFALLNSSECTQALETMGIPEAALALLRRCAVWERPNQLTKDFPISVESRARLTRIFGTDVGPNLQDWISHYDRVIATLPNPLPETVASETMRVVAAWTDYVQAAQHLYESRCRLVIWRMEADGMGDFIKQIQDLEPEIRSRRTFTEADVARLNIDTSKVAVMERYQSQAFSDMCVDDPNWNVPSITDLEDEVRKYIARVDAKVEKYLRAFEKPATMPAVPPP